MIPSLAIAKDHAMLRSTALSISIALASCAPMHSQSLDNAVPLAEGTSVPLGRAVMVGAINVEPERIIEDSRCPINARCVWAGRLVVEARMSALDWTEQTELILGEPHEVRGITVTLISVEPLPVAGSPIEPSQYRFQFKGG